MTYREVMIKLARLAYEKELVTDDDLALMTRHKNCKRNSRNYYRVMEVLEGRKDHVGKVGK